MMSGLKGFAQNFMQIALAGGFVLVAATYNEKAEQIRPEATPLVTALESIQSEVGKTQPQRKEAAKVRDLIAAAQEMTSIADFNHFPLTKPEQDLIERVQNDEFNQGNPFDFMNNIYPIALILERGVKQFSRDAYRSPQFMGGMGYDVVKYEITHPDDSKSYILAYKEKTGPDQVAVGRGDLRPAFSMFVVPQTLSQVYMSVYQNGRPVTNQVINNDQALLQITARVDQSTPLLSSREK